MPLTRSKEFNAGAARQPAAVLLLSTGGGGGGGGGGKGMSNGEYVYVWVCRGQSNGNPRLNSQPEITVPHSHITLPHADKERRVHSCFADRCREHEHGTLNVCTSLCLPENMQTVLHTAVCQMPQRPPVPGWTRHVDRDPAEGVDKFAARIALRDVLTRVEVPLGDAFYKGIEGLLVHLRAGTGGFTAESRGLHGSIAPRPRRLKIALFTHILSLQLLKSSPGRDRHGAGSCGSGQRMTNPRWIRLGTRRERFGTRFRPIPRANPVHVWP